MGATMPRALAAYRERGRVEVEEWLAREAASWRVRGGEAMPARTGEEYITGLRERAAEVYICGEQVKDVTTHPAFRNGVRTLASLYDMQHDPALRDAMTYMSPTTGDRVGLSFLIPRTIQD